MFVYINTMFYTMALLLVVGALVFQLTLLGKLQVLTALMLLIVYVGAMIILIGYICAVAPNVVTVSSNSSIVIFIVFILSIAFVFFSYRGVASVSPFFVGSSPVIYFYTHFGLSIFIIVALALFLTLLMVTSQYFSPKGPFRSVSDLCVNFNIWFIYCSLSFTLF